MVMFGSLLFSLCEEISLDFIGIQSVEKKKILQRTFSAPSVLPA